MVYYISKQNRLAARVSSDTGEFRSLDKLDKWIYLDPTAQIIRSISCYDEWNAIPDSVLSGHWCSETPYEFERHNITPDQLGHYFMSPTVVSVIYRYIRKKGIIKTHVSDHTWREMRTKIMDASKKALSVQIEHLLGGVDNQLFQFSNDGVQHLTGKMQTIPPDVGKFWCAAEDCLNVIAIRKRLYAEHLRKLKPEERVRQAFEKEERLSGGNPFVVQLPSMRATITLTHDISILALGDRKYVLNEDLLLEVCNKVIETFCALLYNHLQSGTILPDNQYECFLQFLDILAEIYSQCRISNVFDYNSHKMNIPFKFGKAMECLGVAYMIRTEDLFEGWMNDRLLHGMWSELYLLGIVGTLTIDEHALGQLFAKMATPQIAEVIGTVKLMGHPSIEINLGADQLHQRTHAQLAIDPDAVRAGMGVIIRDLTKSFLIKYKRFPVIVQNDPNLDPSVAEIFQRSIYPDTFNGQRIWSRVTPHQWATVKFGKNSEFDPVDNQLVLIKDKALGLTRSQIWYLLIEDAPDKEVDKAKALLKRRELRRTLLSFLSDPDFSRTFSQYFNNYSEQNEWDNAVLDYLVIKLTAKELELKEIGRFFGASPLVERNRRNVQEHNTKLLMSDLVNEQLMTQDELGIMRKLLSFRYFGNVYPEHHLYQISFDFSKWNNNFRHESVDIPGAHILDRWFGTKIYGKTMRAFEESLVYLREENYTRYWEGQLGGIEGLNQDTWSFIFLGGVKHALDEAGFKYQVTVKGDDVRAVIAIPEDQIQEEADYNRIRDIILQRLQELCQSMGWQLNPQESFVSLTLIATSKQYQIRQTWLPAATKKIMKMMSLSNLLFPTLEDLVGSIFSCAHSACSQATAIIPAYTSALMVACWELYRGFQGELRLTSDQLAILAMWPQVLGGPGSLPLQTFFVRGENDMLSVSVALFSSIIRFHNGGLKPIAERVLLQNLDQNPDNQLLISDPYSICIDIPERPSSLLKRLIRNKLKKWVKNADIRHLLSDIGEQEKQGLLDSLSSMTPYLAKVATVIFECSPFYLIEEVLAKFMESPTVVALFSQGRLGVTNMKSVMRALSKVLAASVRRKKYWAQILDGRFMSQGLFLGINREHFYDITVCPTKLAQLIRNTAWDKEIVGITYPSLTTQLIISPAMSFHRTWPNWNIQDLCYNISIYAEQAIRQTNLDTHHYASFGNTKPWEGTETANKVKLPKMESLVRTPTLNKVSKLILLHQMLGNLGPVIRRALRSCLQALTYVNLQDVIELMPRGEAGHVGHRLAINAFSTTTMPNFRHNILQLIRISDEHLTITKLDRTDRTINFVAIHFYLACICLFPLQFNQKLPRDYPTIMQAMFHPESPTTRDYEMCRSCCCALIDDFELRFGQPFPDTLYKFSNLRLVGCSDYETGALIRAKAELVLHKAQSAARQDELDPNDPLAVEEAANTVMSQLSQQSAMILRAAVSADYFRVPTGPLLDTVKANIGLASLNTISITVIQAIPPEPLYRCLVTTLAMFVLDNISNAWTEHGLLDIELIAPYLNPLKHLFNKLITSGVMDRVVSGCEAVGWINPPFSLGGGDLTSPARCSISFLVAHKPLFRQWIDGQVLGLRFIPIIHMESDEEIHRQLMRAYESRLSAITVILNNTCPLNLATSHLMFLICRLLNNYPEQGHTMRDHILQLCLAEPRLIEGNLRVVILSLLTEEVDRDEANELVPYLSIENVAAVVRLMICCALHWFVFPGDWVDLPPEQLVRGQDYDLLVVDIDRLEPIELPGEQQQLPANLVTICRYLTLELYHIMRNIILNTWLNIILGDNVMSRTSQRIMDLMLGKITRWVRPYQAVHINAVTEEESFRVLRTHGRLAINDPINRNRLITDIARLRGEAIRQARAQQEIQFPCRLSNRATHLLIEGIQYQHLVPMQNDFLIDEYIRGTVAGLINPETYREVETLYVDKVEYMRAVGRHNTSVAKYIDMFSKISLVQRIQDIGGDQPIFICLADGLGGVTAYLVKSHPNAKVIYNSLLFDPLTGEPVADCGINQEPIEALDPYIRDFNRDSVLYRGFGDGNLSNVAVQELIIDQNTRIHGNPVLITLDADINWDIDIAEYWKLLWGAIHVALRTMGDGSICIFKTFLLEDIGLHKVIVFLYSSFHHFHIYRSRVTRQHSCEIFLIFSQPRDLHQALVDYNRLRSHNYPYNNAIVGVANQQLRPMMRLITSFKQEGYSEIRVAFREWVGTVGRMGGYPLRLDVILRWFGISPDNHPPCYCQIWNWLSQLSFESWRHWTEELYEDRRGVRRTRPVVTSGRGHTLAAGNAFLRFLSLRITALAVLRCVSVLCRPAQCRLPIEGDFGPLLNDIYTLVHDALALSHHLGQCQLLLGDGYLIRRDNKYHDCLSNVVRQAFHKILGLAGCLALINSSLAGVHPELQATYIQAFHRGLALQDCCLRNAQESWNEMIEADILCEGLDVRWSEMYHIAERADLEYRYAQRLPLNTLRRQRRNLVQEDEEAQQEILTMGIDEPFV